MKKYTREEIAGKFIVRSRSLTGSPLECITYVSGERAGLPFLYDSEEQARTDKYFDEYWDEVIRAEDYFTFDDDQEKRSTRKYFAVSYFKKTGEWSVLNVKARNEKEAIANAKDNCFTGSHFQIIGETKPTKDTVKGGGSHRMN